MIINYGNERLNIGGNDQKEIKIINGSPTSISIEINEYKESAFIAFEIPNRRKPYQGTLSASLQNGILRFGLYPMIYKNDFIQKYPSLFASQFMQTVNEIIQSKNLKFNTIQTLWVPNSKFQSTNHKQFMENFYLKGLNKYDSALNTWSGKKINEIFGFEPVQVLFCYSQTLDDNEILEDCSYSNNDIVLSNFS